MDYRPKAIQCVKDTVLPLQRRQFEACGCSLDAQYKTYGRSEGFFAAVLEPGRVYEMGYPRCVCPEVLQGTVTCPSHCECSRQSILYILQELLPGKEISVEILETVLQGGNECRFLVHVL